MNTRQSLKASSFALFNSFEMLLVIFLLALGGMMLSLGWDNPRLVGYIPAGTINIIGGIVCAWLIWRRRGTQRSTLLACIFVQNFASLIEGILKWRAQEEGARWPMTLSVLVVLMLAFIIVEEIHRRKQAARDAVFESPLSGTDDQLMAAQAINRVRLEFGHADKFALTVMVLMLLGGALGLLSLALQLESQNFWPQLLISLGFLAAGFVPWKVRRQLKHLRSSLQDLDNP